MLKSELTYAQENATYDFDIEILSKQVFGPGRFVRASYHVREGGPHDRSLSFVALQNYGIIGSVRMTHIVIGMTPGLLLGPLAVSAQWKNQGIGRTLMRMTMEAARLADHNLVLLVGDESYYGLFGFRKVISRKVIMPLPVHPDRLLVCELVPHKKELSGFVRHANRV